uniref:Uncharacterized protein n=1 Tax=Arundo donax TaxID=35708 RepID=A0A0A8ZMU7_ARUDO
MAFCLEPKCIEPLFVSHTVTIYLFQLMYCLDASFVISENENLSSHLTFPIQKEFN